MKSKKRDTKRRKGRRRAGYNERGDKEGRKIRKLKNGKIIGIEMVKKWR